MGLRSAFLLLCAVFAFTISTSSVMAENEGLAKLDEATAKKLEAQSLADFAKVIELCEEGIEEGLDEGNTQLAKQILAAAALQRAQLMVQRLPRIMNNAAALSKLRAETMASLEKAVEANPELTEALILMAKLETLPGGSRERALERVDQAIDLLKDKPVDQSQVYVLRAGLRESNEDKLADLTKAIEVDGSNTEALQAKIALQLALGKLEEVVSDANKILEKNEDDLFAFEAAIRALTQLGKNQEAIDLLTNQIDKNPEKGVFYRARGRLHLFQKEDEQALADLNKAIELDSRDAEALVLRGQVYYSMGEIEKANRDISDSLLIAPDSVQGVLMRSLVAAEESRYGDAIADMEMLVRADPTNIQWIEQLSSYYQMDNRPRLAIRLLDELIRRSPEEWRAHRLRGDAKLAIGEHKEAVLDYEQAVKLLEDSREVTEEEQATDLDYSGVLNNLSWVLSTSPEDSIRDGKRSLELALKACEATNYEAAHILSTLAAAYAETGDFEKAREWSGKAVELAIAEENPQLDQLKEELESYEQDKPWREEQKTEENAAPVSSATESIDL